VAALMLLLSSLLNRKLSRRLFHNG
jgi:hypothetical protein